MAINVTKTSKYVNKDYFNNPLNTTNGNVITSSSSSSAIDFTKVMMKNSDKTGYILDLPFVDTNNNELLEWDDTNTILNINGSIKLSGVTQETKSKVLYYDPTNGEISYSNIEFAAEQNVHITGDLEVDEGIYSYGGLTVSGGVLQVNNGISLTGVTQLQKDKILFYDSVSGDVYYGDVPPAEFAAEQNVHITGDLEVDEGITSNSFVSITGELQSNGNVSLGGITESIKSKILYYDTSSTLVYYGNVPTGYWSLSGDDISYYTGAVKVGNLNVDDVIDFTSGSNEISKTAINYGDNGSINATNSELQNLLVENQLQVYTNNFYLKYIDSATTSQILYWNSTTGKITYGDAPSGGGSSYWTQSGDDIHYSTGRVGIGTTSPSESLEVSSATNSRVYINSTTDTIVDLWLGSESKKWDISKRNSASSDRLGIYYHNGSSWSSELFTILTGGNVGIGTDSPSAKLDVNGTGIFRTGLNVYSSADTDTRLTFNTNSGTVATIYYYDEATLYKDIRIGTNSTNQGIYYDYSEQKVGINKDSPSYSLDVNGTGRFTSTVTATNFVLSSDIRLKENFKIPVNSFIFIDDVKIYSFNYKEDKNKRLRFGVKAQDLEKYHPEMVYEDSDGYKQVAYIDFLLAKVNSLEQRIKELEKNK